MTDPIADMLTRIRNALAVKKHEVVMPMNKIKYEIAKILKEEGLIYDVEIKEASGKKNKTRVFNELVVILKYRKSGKPCLMSLRRVSKPGLRIYVKKNNLPKVLNNLGIAIISTPQGLMTNKRARKKGLGGEVICEVY